jgi:hypothetical protein
MFPLAWGLAHSEQRGPFVLDLKAKLVYSTGLLIWGTVGYLLCLHVYGRLIKPKIKLS